MDVNLISIDHVLSDYVNRTDIDSEDLDRSLILGWGVEAAQQLISADQLEHIIDIQDVDRYVANKPDNMHKIIQVAFNNHSNLKRVIREEAVQWTKELMDGCKVNVSLECPECHKSRPECGCSHDKDVIKVEVDNDFLRINSDAMYKVSGSYYGTYGLNKDGGRSCVYHPSFEIITPALSSFFGADYHIRHCVNYDREFGNSQIQYKVEQSHIRVNREYGQLLIAYHKYTTDEQGFIMIPDDTDVFEALFWAIETKMLYRTKKKDKNTMNYFAIAKRLEAQHMARAKEKLDGMSFDKWMALVGKYHKRYSNLFYHKR